MLNKKLDASPVINQYNKGLEVLLDSKLPSHFKALIEKIRPKYKRKETSDDFNSKFKNLMHNHTITTGEWIAILEALEGSEFKDKIQEFLNALRSKFSSSIFEKIKLACKTIVPYKNRGTHEAVYSIKQVKNMRQLLIAVFNPVIEALC